MRSILFGCLLLFTAPVWGEDVRSFIEELAEEDRNLLDRFFRLMAQTINGYVIYGDKPLGLVSYVNNTVALPSNHKDANTLPKGKDLWRRLNISPYNKEYAFAIFNCNGYCNFIAINRKAFLKAVNDNLFLFRYALGPTLTAETLLQALIDAKDDFYQVFNNDNALFGILLGYGTQNALLVSRAEFLGCSSVHNQKEKFPFLPCLARMHKADKLQRPSLGYSTVAEELKVLNNSTVSSHTNPPLRPYEPPYFGCEKQSEETQKLLATYQKNQTEILAAVEDPDFLEKTLAKFLTTTSGEVEIPSFPIQPPSDFAESREGFSDKLADLLAINVAYVERRSQNLCLQSYLQGMEYQEQHESEPTQPDQYDQNWRETYDLEEELIRSGNLQQANDYFARLAQSSALTPLIPNQIYYKVLKKGHGQPLSPKAHKASFHYSYKIQGKKAPYTSGTIQEEDLASLVPGLTHALLGMKRGEERWAAIHPSYAYGDRSFFPPNATLLVKVQLLDFQEGEEDLVLSLPHQLASKNIPEMQTRLDTLKAHKYYEKGRYLWHIIRQNGDPIDLKLVKQAIDGVLTDERDCPFKTVEEAHTYSIRFRDYLSNTPPSREKRSLAPP